MILIPVPEGFITEGRDNGKPFEVTVKATLKDGKLSLDEIEGLELAEAEDEEEDFELDEAALDVAAAGGPPV